MADITIRNRGETYAVLLDPAGDHIVIKLDADPLLSFPVSEDSGTFGRVMAVVKNNGEK
jgi:hypothetical protein